MWQKIPTITDRGLFVCFFTVLLFSLALRHEPFPALHQLDAFLKMLSAKMPLSGQRTNRNRLSVARTKASRPKICCLSICCTLFCCPIKRFWGVGGDGLPFFFFLTFCIFVSYYYQCWSELNRTGNSSSNYSSERLPLPLPPPPPSTTATTTTTITITSKFCTHVKTVYHRVTVCEFQARRSVYEIILFISSHC